MRTRSSSDCGTTGEPFRPPRRPGMGTQALGSRSMSTAILGIGSRSRSRACGSPPFLGEVGLTPPLGGRRVVAGSRRVLLDHAGQRTAHGQQLGDLGVDLAHPVAEQRLGVAAGAQALVGDLEQLADLPQPQPGPLGPFDQPQAGDRVLVVQTVAGRGPGRWREQADPFVVADGVGAEPRGPRRSSGTTPVPFIWGSVVDNAMRLSLRRRILRWPCLGRGSEWKGQTRCDS
jgi:hypothetical protein